MPFIGNGDHLTLGSPIKFQYSLPPGLLQLSPVCKYRLYHKLQTELGNFWVGSLEQWTQKNTDTLTLLADANNIAYLAGAF